jgi:hypothetical protein
MNDENSVTAGTKSRRTLRKVKTNDHTKESRHQNCPNQCQQRRIFKGHGRSMNAASVSRNSGSIYAWAGRHHLAQVQSSMSTFLGVHVSREET